ncbi:hypothetical protein [Hymenobacter arizonensis]|uniref:Uncharacterized protein n=1 Tax=Hymenobacter arizonensis TaxID=1227077 RepID=A0A1I5XEA9_HYMAR|nr:hypothetical protein [Hymenobacter arizonensis]SFQ30309.1 hypothetical protein SAMN04515668_1794 [Hymenobacter arizonensis]
MRPELERLALIESQLLHGPAALPAADWHLHQLLDGELHADTVAQQHLYAGLQMAGRRQLRRELAAIHAQLYAARPGGWVRKLYQFLGWLRG